MAIHDEVLRAARRICRERGGWSFSSEEIVRSLAHLNESSVRSHVASRCCVNAPAHHAHRWPYFRRVARGRYEIMPRHRGERTAGRTMRAAVAERAPSYGNLRDTIHAVLHREDGVFVAECLEIAVVTQGRTADEVLSNLQEAVALHLEGEDLAALGITPAPRLAVTFELPSAGDAAPT